MSRVMVDTLTELLDLLTPDAIAPGEFLVERDDDGTRLLWRITEGAPPDGALDPARAGHCCLANSLAAVSQTPPICTPWRCPTRAAFTYPQV